jgi:hypothetical protein
LYNVEYSKEKVKMKTKTLMKKLRDRQFKVVRVTILDNSKELILQMLGGIEND